MTRYIQGPEAQCHSRTPGPPLYPIFKILVYYLVSVIRLLRTLLITVVRALGFVRALGSVNRTFIEPIGPLAPLMPGH